MYFGHSLRHSARGAQPSQSEFVRPEIMTPQCLPFNFGYSAGGRIRAPATLQVRVDNLHWKRETPACAAAEGLS